VDNHLFNRRIFMGGLGVTVVAPSILRAQTSKPEYVQIAIWRSELRAKRSGWL
jgi:hypothetical protein